VTKEKYNEKVRMLRQKKEEDNVNKTCLLDKSAADVLIVEGSKSKDSKDSKEIKKDLDTKIWNVSVLKIFIKN